jgi:hypothetical protein
MQPPPPPGGYPRPGSSPPETYSLPPRASTDPSPPRLSFEGRPSTIRTSGPNIPLIIGGGCLVVLLLGAIGAAVFFMTVGAIRGDAAPASTATAIAPSTAQPDAGTQPDAGARPASSRP